MAVTAYTIADYKSFLSGEKPWPWTSGVLPVSWQRVAAHVRNPRAEDSDVVLLVSCNERDEVTSYLGILPDHVYLPSGVKKFGWMTTWWVKPGADGAGSVLLLMQAISLYNKRLGVSHYSESAARVYSALGTRLTTIVPRTVSLVNLRPDFAVILSRRFNALRAGLPIYRLLTGLSDGWFAIFSRLWFWRRRASIENIRIEYFGSFACRSRDFLQQFDRSAELFRRDADQLEWLLKHKWSLVTPLQDINHGRYWFSANTQRAEFLAFHLHRADNSIGALLILSIRNDMLKVPYAFVADDMYDAAGLAICMHARALSARTLLVVDKSISSAIARQRYPAFRHKRYPRNSLSTLKEQLPDNVYLHDGDGDSAFT